MGDATDLGSVEEYPHGSSNLPLGIKFLNMSISQKVKELIADPQKLTYFFLGVYLLLITYLIFKDGFYLGLDIIFLTLFAGTLIIGKGIIFLKDWIPFVLMFFGYEAMRGIADDLNQQVHISEMIKADRFLFGQLPTVSLQNLLWNSNSLSWYDIIFFFFYLSHFWFIFLIGFIIWARKRKHFKFFSWGFLILCLLGFITYLLFPAMAPWDASRRQYIEGVERLLMEIGKDLKLGGAITILYKWIGPNEVAAMPSLHAAWVWFAFLFLVYFFGKKAFPIFIFPLGLFFTLVYFGEHYVIDILAGLFYASFVFWLMQNFANFKPKVIF